VYIPPTWLQTSQAHSIINGSLLVVDMCFVRLSAKETKVLTIPATS
jgi:hypothetical protein